MYCVVLVLEYEETLASYRHMVGKHKGILIAFLDVCGYASLIPHQNSTNDSLLKGSCNVGFGTISTKYLFSENIDMKTTSWY